MALWTPYTEEALDLTKQNIEKSPDYPHLDHYYYESYGAPQTVPTSQISPDSIKSWNQEDETLSDDMEYQAFERDALQAMAERNGGSLLGNNPRMKRVVQSTQASDDMYRKQRERNNYAAKQSRDRRKLREVRLAFQVTFLKKKLAEMRSQLDSGVCSSCLQRR
ncbi:unnamed protein product [Pieris brassicae]|uniref:BZIP domain-containing protein n=1 Tax=Pieris brassicae TaxID=7116 RepID=A0A9P0TG52_PIEBR|nr:unnamed protein product [Pieris brassicae]